MLLIDDVKGNVFSESTQYNWKEDDDILLKTLFIEKKCTTKLISSVFNIEEESIIERLKQLNLFQQ